MKKCLAIFSLLVLAGCGPSCEERGGKYEFRGYIPVMVGSIPVLNPIYECEIPK